MKKKTLLVLFVGLDTRVGLETIWLGKGVSELDIWSETIEGGWHHQFSLKLI